MMKKIGDYTFEKLDEQSYRITYPDKHTELKHYLAAESLMKRLKEKQNPTNKVKNNVYQPGTEPYFKLQAIVDILSAFVSTHEFAINNVYLDINKGTGRSTVICRRKKDNATYMLLTPTEQEELLNASYTEFSKLLSKKISELKN